MLTYIYSSKVQWMFCAKTIISFKVNETITIEETVACQLAYQLRIISWRRRLNNQFLQSAA